MITVLFFQSRPSIITRSTPQVRRMGHRDSISGEADTVRFIYIRTMRLGNASWRLKARINYERLQIHM